MLYYNKYFVVGVRELQSEIYIEPAGTAPNTARNVGLPEFELPRLDSDEKISMRDYITSVGNSLTLKMKIPSPTVAHGSGT